MIIKRIELDNFRSHEEYSLEFRKKTSLIVGENGCGKTSVLEAIYEALRGKSFRAVDTEIVRRGADYYRIELDYKDGERVIVMFDGEKKTFLAGGRKTARLPKKYRYPVVLFLPEDLHLLESSPTRKREYFDRFLGELDDSYSSSLSRYNKALKQRNELLKNEYVSNEAVFSWDVMLAKYGCEVRKKRIKLVYDINKRLTEVYRTIADNKDAVEIEYKVQGGEVSESEYLARLSREFERDRILGHTGFGVHRDDYGFLFNGTRADGSASRGEVRSIILALKFIEADFLTERLMKRPVVLLDDVFSELDAVRQKCLVKNFKDNQVIITSVEAVD